MNNYLTNLARHILSSHNFIVDFPKSLIQEALNYKPTIDPYFYRDLRNLPWISIDNPDSLDLDQLTYAHHQTVLVAIADVDVLVEKNSLVDKHAKHNTTSIYTPTYLCSMLPKELSTDRTSLNQNDRAAMIIEMEVSLSGEFKLTEIYPAWVYNHAKLNYHNVGNWLEHKTPFDSHYPLDIYAQLSLQDTLAEQIEKFRHSQGALSFNSKETKILTEGGQPINLQGLNFNRANRLIENFMIAANALVATFFKTQKLPVIRRVVKKPRNWQKIVDIAQTRGYSLPLEPEGYALRQFLLNEKQINPEYFPILSLSIMKLIGKADYIADNDSEGHFDLAQSDYLHCTAPNRRFCDLIIQRLLKKALHMPVNAYSQSELIDLAGHCNKQGAAATKVERQLYKSAAAMALESQLGKVFSAIVTGASEKGTWVRLLAHKAEGKVCEGYENLEVGDIIKVKLVNLTIDTGFIDFIKI